MVGDVVRYTERGYRKAQPKARRENALHKMGVLLSNPQPLLDFMKTHGVPQIQLADDLGINRAHFNRLLNGKTPTSVPLIVRLANHIGVPWYVLVLPPDVQVVSKEEAEFLKLWRQMQPPAPGE